MKVIKCRHKPNIRVNFLQQQPTPSPLISHYTFQELVWTFLKQVPLYRRLLWLILLHVHFNKQVRCQLPLCSISSAATPVPPAAQLPRNLIRCCLQTQFLLPSPIIHPSPVTRCMLVALHVVFESEESAGRRAASGGSIWNEMIWNGCLFSSSAWERDQGKSRSSNPESLWLTSDKLRFRLPQREQCSKL